MFQIRMFQMKESLESCTLIFGFISEFGIRISDFINRERAMAFTYNVWSNHPSLPPLLAWQQGGVQGEAD
jgi:hypothetical protein